MPVLGTVDYSPIISSLNARGRAGQANISERYEGLKRSEQTRQAVAGTIDGAFKLAGTVVGLIEQADLEKNKTKVVDFQVEAAAKIDNAIAQGQWEMDENGNYKLTGDFADWYKQQRESIAGSAKTTKVRRWMQDQVDSTYENLSTQATGMLVRRQAAEYTAALEDTIGNLTTIALDTGDFTPIEEAINGSKVWTDIYKGQRLEQAKKDFKIGRASREAIALARDKGPQGAEEYLKNISGVGKASKDERDAAQSQADEEYSERLKAIEKKRQDAKAAYEESQSKTVVEGVNQESKEVKKRLADAESKYRAALAELDQQEQGLEQERTYRKTEADQRLAGAEAMSEEDIGKVRHNYANAMKNELAALQGNADMVIKQASESGQPMGAAVKAYIEKNAPEGLKADLKTYVEQRRDAAMWEQFQAKANAPGADLMGLYQSIKNNEPGKKGYTGHYEEAQVEQTRELNYLAGILGLEKETGSAATDKWVDGTIAAWKTKVEIGGASTQEAVKFLTGEIFDLNPEKATSAIAYIMKRESPAYADTIRGMGTYIDRIAKDRKLNPTQKEQLEGILRDTLRQSFYDKPNMNAADFAKLQTELTNAVVGKGAEFMTELSKPGWFTSSDDGLGKFVKRMEENPTIANAAAYTEAQFDRNQPYRVVLNPFMADHIRQAQDRGRTLLAEYTGTDPGEIVASFQSEGEWDISAIPQYVMKSGDGKERTFVLTAPDGKLGFIETTGGKRVPLEAPKKPDKPSAPPPSGVMQSTDLTSIPKDTVSKYIDTDISAKWQEATKGITGRERMALPTTKEAQIRWLISKGVLQ